MKSKESLILFSLFQLKKIEKKYPWEGKKYLQKAHKANHFINWMYSEIKPYLKGNIFEIGSGIGAYSEKIAEDFPDNQIILSDIDTDQANNLSSKFEDRENVTAIELDISDSSVLNKINNGIDSVFALNVFEHIRNDVSSFKNVYDILNPGGKFVLLVPAHKFLFNNIDISVGHFRRYSKKELIQKISLTNFEIEKIYYFNFLSILGWYITGNLLGKKIDEKSIGLFNYIVPILRPIEKYLLKNRIGISLIAVLKKQ